VAKNQAKQWIQQKAVPATKPEWHHSRIRCAKFYAIFKQL